MPFSILARGEVRFVDGAVIGMWPQTLPSFLGNHEPVMPNVILQSSLVHFYSQVRKYHHESGKAYWTMDSTPEGAQLVNRCDESQTCEARLAAGTLPDRQVVSGRRETC
jgi:hypothetical protein